MSEISTVQMLVRLVVDELKNKGNVRIEMEMDLMSKKPCESETKVKKSNRFKVKRTIIIICNDSL